LAKTDRPANRRTVSQIALSQNPWVGTDTPTL
jgi:hypothetical protein